MWTFKFFQKCKVEGWKQAIRSHFCKFGRKYLVYHARWIVMVDRLGRLLEALPRRGYWRIFVAFDEIKLTKASTVKAF